MSKQIAIRDDLYERLKDEKKKMGWSFSQIIEMYINHDDLRKEV